MRGVRNSISELLRNVQLTVSLMASFCAEPQPFKYLREQDRYPGKQIALTVNTYVEVSFFFPPEPDSHKKKVTETNPHTTVERHEVLHNCTIFSNLRSCVAQKGIKW